MSRLPESKINEIRHSVDIVDVVGQYLALSKKGRNYVGICPFHNDTNPSLSVSRDKQIYKCFVCGNGGNVFTFLQQYLNLSYIEAVKNVAQLGNVDISEYHLDYQPRQIKNELINIYAMNNDAQSIYSYYLNTKLGYEAKNYLRERHFNDELIKYFGIGYAPAKNVLYPSFKDKYGEDDLVQGGLMIEGDQYFHDRFSDRIMFPIHDDDGRIVGFSGRIYKITQEGSKYVNSPETKIFNKGNLLYNYHRCINSVKKEGFVYLLEGFMDVIALYKAGIENSVALMGTALTKDHIHLLKRLTHSVYICLDGDRAGKMAAAKIASALSDENMDIRIIVIPDEKDPDEVFESEGKAGLEEILKKTQTLIEFMMETKYLEIDINNYEDRKAFLEEMCPYINEISDDIDREYYIERLSQLSEFTPEIIRSRLSGIKTIENNYTPLTKKEEGIDDKYHNAEKGLLFYMMNSRDVSDLYEVKLGFMYDDDYRIIASYIVDYYHNHNTMDIAQFIDVLPEKLVNTIIDIYEMNLPLPYEDKAIEDYIRNIKNKTKEMRKQQLLEQFNYVLDPLKKSQILQQILDLDKE